MKKYALSLLVSTLFVVAVFFLPRTIDIKLRSVVHDSYTAAEDADDLLKWDVMRLADPATGKIPDNIRQKELAFAATLPNDQQSLYYKTGSVNWQMRGPWNVGGRTRAFAADVQNEAILLAGTAAGGMWRSVDTGKTWTLTTQLAIQQSVSCLAQDVRTKHSNVWYYGSGECYGTSASASGAFYLGNGLYRSLDNGQTWKVLPATNSNSVSFKSFWQAEWNVATDPSAPDSESVVYVSAIGTIYRSADTGNTWKVVMGGSTSAYSYYTDVQVSKTGAVYATMSSDGPDKGIWRSTDGTHFTNITPSNFPKSYNRVVIGISPTDPNQVYFLANTDTAGMADTNFLGQIEWDGLWKYKYLSGSGDSAGGAWHDLSANLPATGSVFDKYNSQTSYDMIVRFLPTDTSTVFIGGTDLFRSTTGFFDANHTKHIGGYGVNTAPPVIQVYPNHHPDQHAVFFSNSNPYVMYSGCDGGLFKTYNDTAVNVNWTTLDNGYVTTMFYTGTSAHDLPGSSILVGGAQDNDCLFDNSTSLTNPWTKPLFGDGSFVSIQDSAKTFYYSTQNGKMFKSKTDTTTGLVTAFNRIDPIGGKGYQFVNPFEVDPNNSNIMYLAGGKYLWRNNNLSGIPYAGQFDSISTNWTQFPDSVPVAGATISALAVSTAPANRVYYGTSEERIYRVDNANTGTPTPKDITPTKNPVPFPSGDSYITCIAVDPLNADNVMVVFSNYAIYNLFYTNNGGTTWSKIAGNLHGTNSPSLRWAAIQHLPTGGTIYWVGASTGLYATTYLAQDSLIYPKGDTTRWVQQSTNMIGNSVVNMIDIRPQDGLVTVATHTHGMYTANITSLGQVATVNSIKAYQGFGLKAYPNPTQGPVTIDFTLAEGGDVGLRLFDMEGRLVKTLENERMGPGEHLISLNDHSLKNGIYFCSLTSGSRSETVRLVIAR